MLKQRIITAVVLLAILLPALFWPSPVPFMAITLVMLAAGGWEWGRLNGLGAAGSIAAGVVTLALCAGAWALGWVGRPLPWLWTIAAAAWVLGG
nr:phosphatidate cytidylyltransferase [Ramlibacter sp.]